MRQQRIVNQGKHRTPKGALRIQNLTTVAADLFLERGYESVAVDDLIARVGGSRRNIYGHFGGKDGLFIDAVTQLCAQLAEPLEQLTINDSEPQQALTTFGRQLLQTVLQPRTLELHRLMVAEGKRFPELARAVFHAGHTKAADVLTPWIEARQAGRPCEIAAHLSPRTLAEQFVNMVVMEAQLRALIGLDPQPLPIQQAERIIQNTVSTFLHGALHQKDSHEHD